MIKKILGALTLATLLAANANAASLSLLGPTDVAAGDNIELQLFGNFFEEGYRAGGGLLSYDPSLVTLSSIVLELPLDATQAAFACPGNANCVNDTVGGFAQIAMSGIFSALIAADVADDVLLATITFTTTSLRGPGGDAIFNFEPESPWLRGDGMAIDTPGPAGFSVNVQSSVVPLPAAVWFMVGGLSTLLGFRRK